MDLLSDINNLERWFRRETPVEEASSEIGKWKPIPMMPKKSEYDIIENINHKSNTIIPSKEQQLIITKASEGFNIIIDSVFGSGKTTTLLEIAKRLKKLQILNLTYNSRLKINTRTRIKQLGLNHIETHSYHALAVKYYSTRGNTDSGIQYILENNLPIRKSRIFQLLILDEQQDMTPLYHRLIIKFLNDSGNNNLQFILLGDTYQNIYSYKGSDSRYLGLANDLFKKYTSKPWLKLCISTSFRTTDTVRYFINQHILGYKRIMSQKPGSPVRYLLLDAFGKDVFYEVQAYLALKYRPEDIFILAPSLRCGKHKSPVRRLENYLVEKGIPCYVPVDDNEELSESIMEGKIVFSSFHQVKGLERSVVIVFGFDLSYFTYYAKDLPIFQCPNPIYVALSRSLKRLSLIHHYENNYFPTIKQEYLNSNDNIEVVKYRSIRIKKKQNTENKKPQEIGVVDLVRHLGYQTEWIIKRFVDLKIIQKPQNVIQLPSKIKTKNGLSENISHLNGLALPMTYESTFRNGRSSIYNYLLINYNDLKSVDQQKFKNISQRIETESNISISDYLYLSNLYNSKVSGYNSKLKQITDYDWLTETHVQKVNKRLSKQITSESVFEHRLTYQIFNYRITGFIDILDQNIIWEIKCVKQLDFSHYFQALVYAWLYYKNIGKLLDIRIFNLTNNEIHSLSLNQSSDLDLIIEFLVKERYHKEHQSFTDDLFLSRNILSKDSFATKKKNSALNCLIETDSDED